LEESDALVGIGFLQMPTTRGPIIRLDAAAFAAQTICRSSVRGATGQRGYSWEQWAGMPDGGLALIFQSLDADGNATYVLRRLTPQGQPAR
jgi:hypothetical protein